MNIKRLHEILALTTMQLRKGPEVVKTDGPVQTTEIYMMPHEGEVDGDALTKVDVEFMIIGVRQATAELHKAELIDILNHYPDPGRLAGGPSYIEVGGVIGDQGAAFCLFALGKALDLWDIITPSKLGMEGEQAREAAGRGFIMITGYTAKETV